MESGDCVIAIVPFPAEFALIQASLSAEGIEVLPASCLLDAILYQLTGRASVILYDADAPEHWREALEQFLLLRPASRVVFLSRLADDHMWIDVLDQGGYDLLMKPLRAEELRGTVRNALGRVGRAAA